MSSVSSQPRQGDEVSKDAAAQPGKEASAFQ